jgi:hypothetical protein
LVKVLELIEPIINDKNSLDPVSLSAINPLVKHALKPVKIKKGARKGKGL